VRLPDRVVLENLPFAAVLHDAAGNLVWANGHAEHLLAPEVGEQITLPPQAARALDRVRGGGGAESDLRERLRSRDGSIRWLKVDIVPVGDGEAGKCLLTTVIDITEWEGARHRSQALMALAQNLARNVTNYQATLHTLARETAELLGDGVLVTMVSPDGRWLQRAAHYHRDPVRRAAGRDLLAEPYPANEGPVGHVLETGEALRIDAFDIPDSLDDKYAEFSRQFGIRCFVIAPLIAEGRILGTLGVSREAPPYTDEDVSLLQSLADTAALTILNARLQAEASQRLARLVSLHQSEMAAVASLDLRLTLRVLLEQVRIGLNVQAAAIYSGDPSTREREPIAAVGEQPSSSVRARFAEREIQRLAIPLTSKGRRYGSLELFNPSPFELDAEWSQFLETLAARAASAIENSRLAEQAARLDDRPAHRAGDLNRQLSRLSARQQFIFELASEGKSNREIAATVKLSENTVKFHLREIFRKLGLRNRVELARLAHGGQRH